MRRPLDVTADLWVEHRGDRLRLVGSGRRLSLEIPTLRAAFALRRAEAASFFSRPAVQGLFAASDVSVDMWLAGEPVGVVHPSGATNLTARLMGLRGVALRPVSLLRAALRRVIG